MFVIGELLADWAIAYKCLGAILGNSRDIKVVEADTNFVANSVQNSSVELKEKINVISKGEKVRNLKIYEF